VHGPARGFPSLCIGSNRKVEILHASAALGSAVYRRSNTKWTREKSFDWRVRDRDVSPTAVTHEHATFEKQLRWVSTSSRFGSPVREFKVLLDPTRRSVGVAFLATDNMAVSHWPAQADNACRDLDLLKGNPATSLPFDPSTWNPIE
jgi:hypothetical protein